MSKKKNQRSYQYLYKGQLGNNITLAILEKMNNLIASDFCLFLGAPILFSPTVVDFAL